MTYSDCDPDRPTTPESRLRDALEADVARHLAEMRAGFEADRFEKFRHDFTRALLGFAFAKTQFFN